MQNPGKDRLTAGERGRTRRDAVKAGSNLSRPFFCLNGFLAYADTNNLNGDSYDRNYSISKSFNS
jgi:hypothetical protein